MSEHGRVELVPAFESDQAIQESWSPVDLDLTSLPDDDWPEQSVDRLEHHVQ